MTLSRVPNESDASGIVTIYHTEWPGPKAISCRFKAMLYLAGFFPHLLTDAYSKAKHSISARLTFEKKTKGLPTAVP